jgi:hypothetical protein
MASLLHDRRGDVIVVVDGDDGRLLAGLATGATRAAASANINIPRKLRFIVSSMIVTERSQSRSRCA